MSTSTTPTPPPWSTPPPPPPPGAEPTRSPGPARVLQLLGVGAVAVLGFGGVFWGLFGQAERDEAGSIVAEGDLDVAELRVGDCFDDDPATADEAVFEVFGVAAAPCGTPHDNEVFHRFDLAAETLPSDEEVGDEVFETCVEAFESFVDVRYEDSELDFSWFWPTKNGWRKGDRAVTCYLHTMDLTKLEGSAAGTGR
jgi:hypothetical protein